MILKAYDFIEVVCKSLNVDPSTVQSVEISAVAGDPMVSVTIRHLPLQGFELTTSIFNLSEAKPTIE